MPQVRLNPVTNSGTSRHVALRAGTISFASRTAEDGSCHDGGPAFTLSPVPLARRTIEGRCRVAVAFRNPSASTMRPSRTRASTAPSNAAAMSGPRRFQPKRRLTSRRELVPADTPGIIDDVPHRELCLSARDLRRRPLRQLVASRHSDYLELARVGVCIRPLCAADQATATEAFQGGLECVTDPITRASDSPMPRGHDEAAARPRWDLRPRRPP